MKPKVSVFIVGAPKAGTTALYALLETHPQMCMSRDKEPNFFSWSEIEKQHLYYRKRNIKNPEAYAALFDVKAGHVRLGEASVSYLFYPEIPTRLHSYNPDAKIIIALRNPVERAQSHYLMDYSLGLVKETPETIWANGEFHPATGNYYQQYFLLGLYCEQVMRYLTSFGRENVHIVHFTELRDQPEKVYAALIRFLGLSVEITHTPLQEKNVTVRGKNALIRYLYSLQGLRKSLSGRLNENTKSNIKNLFFSKKSLPEFSQGLIRQLHEFYQDDLERLSRETGIRVPMNTNRSLNRST